MKDVTRGLWSGVEMEQWREEPLAPYAMRASQSRGRKHPEPKHAQRGHYRGTFQRDRDRVIHSTAFRRLEYKTQVFVNHEGDHYRTRLTHTLEVAQISRSVARILRLNEDLCEAAALAHDLGHTPFGHSGEEALHELMENEGGFEHNLHGLRVVDRLEKRYPGFDGLNLTYEVRESIAKHTTRYDRPEAAEFDVTQQALLEAQVVEAADEIAYNNHDLEDGLKAHILEPEALMEQALWRGAWERVVESCPEAPEPVRRAQTIATLINLEVTDLLEHSARRLEESGAQSVDEVRAAGEHLIGFGPSMEEAKQRLERFLLEHLYQHYRVARMSNKAKRFIRELFEEYRRRPEQLPPDYQQRIPTDGLKPTVCDYIAGMTDRYAQDEYKRLFYPFERV